MRLDTIYKRNTDPGLFLNKESETNCGSFALNVTDWYLPYLEGSVGEDDELLMYEVDERMRFAYDLAQEGYSAMEIMEVITDRDFEFILKTCPWLIPISEKDALSADPKERIVAYRLSLEIPDELEDFDIEENGDFHFRVRIDGDWWEKNGASAVHKVEEAITDIWEVDDWLVYSGPIKYAKFRQEEI